MKAKIVYSLILACLALIVLSATANASTFNCDFETGTLADNWNTWGSPSIITQDTKAVKLPEYPPCGISTKQLFDGSSVHIKFWYAINNAKSVSWWSFTDGNSTDKIIGGNMCNWYFGDVVINVNKTDYHGTYNPGSTSGWTYVEIWSNQSAGTKLYCNGTLVIATSEYIRPFNNNYLFFNNNAVAGWYVVVDNVYVETGAAVVDNYNLESATATVNKGTTDTVLSVNVTRPYADGVHASTVDYGVINGTAFNGADFTLAPGTLSFGAGETSKTVDITIEGSSYYTGDRQFTFYINNPTNGVQLGDLTSMTVFINDTVQPDGPFSLIVNPLYPQVWGTVEATLIIPSEAVESQITDIMWTDTNENAAQYDPRLGWRIADQFRLIDGTWHSWTPGSTGSPGQWLDLGLTDISAVDHYQWNFDRVGSFRLGCIVQSADGDIMANVSQWITVQSSETLASATVTAKEAGSNPFVLVDGVSLTVTDIQDGSSTSYTVNGYSTIQLKSLHYYTFSATKSGYKSFNVTQQIHAGSNTVYLDLVDTSAPGGEGSSYLDFYVIDQATGQYIGNSYVDLTGLTTKTQFIQGGYYRFTVTDGQAYSWTARATGYTSRKGSFTGGEVSEVTAGLTSTTATVTPAPSTPGGSGGDLPGFPSNGPRVTLPATGPLNDQQRQSEVNNIVDDIIRNSRAIIGLLIVGIILSISRGYTGKKK
jgi:hypothetical protein